MKFPIEYRKQISHLGTIRTKTNLHPKQWVCKVIGASFDPGNAVYAMVLKAIMPRLKDQDRSWNDETLGDVVGGSRIAGGGYSRHGRSAMHLSCG